MEILRLSKPDRRLKGRIALDGSKSLSNRALLMLALAGADPDRWLRHVSTSKDTATMLQLLKKPAAIYDTGDAGTTFRFLTAYLALQPGMQVLTGSARMCERPVGELVEALRQLGATIEYLGKTGYPPLRIGPPVNLGKTASIQIKAGVSSQFLSALLMIGPYLPQGLELTPVGTLVSRPYIEMTMRMMNWFGASADWHGERIIVRPGRYEPRPLSIEADWSAASYWYALAAFSEEAELTLEGLSNDSWQGDAVIAEIIQPFGVETTFLPVDNCVVLRQQPHSAPASFEWDFLECPDIAQTMAVVCAGLGVPGVFAGLDTLAIKETDRSAALRAELAKVGVALERALPAMAPKINPSDIFLLRGKATWMSDPRFASYGDHRMAMSLATLAMFRPIEIEQPEVVRKSYPAFWNHLSKVGFTLKKFYSDA